MNRHLSILLAGPSLFVLATAAVAQPTTTQAPPAESTAADEATQAQQANQATSGGDEGTIVITARRRAESLLDVPQTVKAVTGKDLQDFNLTQFKDVQALVPGLTLVQANNGFTTIATMRGVSFDRSSQAEVGTVEMYLNETSVEPNLIFQGNFDVGQFETLKGPQGTLRGRSSPSGSITVTTRRPDLNEWGGYASFIANSHGGLNGQAAVGVPIIQDVLAIRVAGLLIDDDADGIKSVNNPKDPFSHSWAYRGTIRFEPTDTLSAVVMYQKLHRRVESYGSILFGPGSLGWSNPLSTCTGTVNHPVNSICPATASLPAVFAPANFNGPPLDASDRKAVQDFPNITRQDEYALTAQIDWKFAGQKLSYVGGLSKYKLNSLGGGGDQTNTFVGHNLGVDTGNFAIDKRKSHELRLSSDERLADIFDYTVGGYYAQDKGSTFNTVILNQFAGQFGSPLGTGVAGGPGLLSPYTYDPKYESHLIISGPRKAVEKAIFGDVMAHIGNKIELEGGIRRIWFDYTKSVTPFATPAQLAVRNTNATLINPNAACPATFSQGVGPLGVPIVNAPLVGSTYPGTCDYQLSVSPTGGILPLGVTPIPETKRNLKAWVYKLGASYHITPDLMVYATYGTSWRPGPGPITALAACSGANQLTQGFDPNTCQQFNFLDPEKSRGIELGFKGAFLNRRLAFSVAVYRQKYDGLVSFIANIPLLTGACPNHAPPYVPGEFTGAFARCSVGTSQFSYNADAIVKGIDADMSFRVSDDLNLGASFSYSHGRYSNAAVPCRDELNNSTGLPGMDGIPDNGTGLSTPAGWLNAGGPYGPAICNVNSTSTQTPPWNVNARAEYSHPVFTGARAFVRGLFNYTPRNKNAAATGFIPHAYSILNLWLGLRADNGAWEFSVSGRNILNNKTRLTQGLQVSGLTGAGRFGATTLTFAPLIPNSQSGNSGYTTVSFVDRREFSVNLRFAFGSR